MVHQIDYKIIGDDMQAVVVELDLGKLFKQKQAQ